MCVRKPAISVLDQVRKNGLYMHRRWLEAGNFGFRNKRNCTIRIVKTKALISFAVTAKLTAKLISAFVYTYANCWFSHAKAHIRILELTLTLDTFSDMFMMFVQNQHLRWGKDI